MKPAASVYKLLNSSGGSDLTLTPFAQNNSFTYLAFEPLFSVLEDVMRASVTKVVWGGTSEREGVLSGDSVFWMCSR